MHISEGVLSGPVLGLGWALTAAGVTIGLKRMDLDRVMTVALFAAAFFVASLIHFPVGPASVHLVLSGLLGVMLGWAAFPAIFIGLALQAVFFQFGGLTTLGVTTFNLAAPAVLCGTLFRRAMPQGAARPQGARLLGIFLAGALPVLLSGLLVAASLTMTDEGFLAAAGALLAAHAPVMLIEGAATVFVVAFLAKVQPDMLTGVCVRSARPCP